MTYRECGPGWDALLDRLEADLRTLGWTTPPQQIKEKFGGLRYYVYMPDAAPDLKTAVCARIEQAEREAAETCEQCGAGGAKLRAASWWRTTCDACAPANSEIVTDDM